MDFCLLGPITVSEGGRFIPLPRQKQRALLALLLLNAGRVVSTDRLLDDLWGEEPPRTAKSSLHNHISQLREALGPEVLITQPPGYVLDVAPERIDLVRFEQLVARARDADVAERATILRRALALWRGPPLAELSFEQFAQGKIQELEEERLAALEERIDADLALGRHGELVAELEGLTAQHPLRERLRAQLMLTLYRCDRQAEALEVYHEARRVLVAELGIEPSVTLRELEQAILRQDPTLAPAAGDRSPVVQLPQPDETARLPVESQHLRKSATILYAEIAGVGVEEVDPERLHRAIVRASHELRAAAEYHGGTIERLMGDELTAVFGVAAAHEDDAVRAARAAVQLRRALASVGPDEEEGEISIESRTVIATGEVDVVDRSLRPELAGAAISLVRHVAETAQPGEILLDLETAARAGNAIQTEATEPRPVRGRKQPISVVRLLGLAERGTPDLTRREPFVGRKAELAKLRGSYRQAVAESSSVVARVVGDAGIGKSRLLAEFAAAIHTDATVMVGTCESYGDGATFQPLSEAIAPACEASIADLFDDEEDGELIAERLAELVDLGQGVDAPTGEVFWAVRRFLEALARQRPVVLVLEDVHWAEPTLLDLVEYLESWSNEAPLLIVCLARPEILESRPAWATSALRLEPLTRAEATELIEIAGGDTLSTEDRARMGELAEGNPLFAEQLVAYAADKGPEGLDSVPPSLSTLLSSRLDRLDPMARGVLQRASVVGRDFWHGAILHLSPPLEVPSVGRLLLELTRRNLVEQTASTFPREDAFRFHHALIRDVAYNSIPSELRAELHEQVADWLELQAPGQDELVGYHLEQAYRCRTVSGTTDGRARRLAADGGDRLAEAGLRAAKSGDTPAAASLLDRAASLLGPGETNRRDLLPELGILRWRGGDIEGAEKVLRLALETATAERDRRAELRARLELANLALVREPEGGADEFLSLAAQAIPVLEELGDDRAVGRVWYSLAFVHGGLHCLYGQSAQAAERAAECFRRSGWSVAPCFQELAAGLYYGPTTVPNGVRLCKALLEETDRGGSAHVLTFLAGLEAMAGNFDEARALASRARTIYEELAWTIYVWTNWATVAADIELLAGDYTSAELILSESCRQLGEWGEHAHLATQAAQLGQALYGQGRYEDAAEWGATAALRAATDDAGAQFLSMALRAKTLAQFEEFEQAEALGGRAVSFAAETDALSQHASVLLDVAEVARLEGRLADESTMIEQAVALFERKGNIAGSAAARSTHRGESARA